eukprot:1051028-Prymnesium_polylepis.1
MTIANVSPLTMTCLPSPSTHTWLQSTESSTSSVRADEVCERGDKAPSCTFLARCRRIGPHGRRSAACSSASTGTRTAAGRPCACRATRGRCQKD